MMRLLRFLGIFCTPGASGKCAVCRIGFERRHEVPCEYGGSGAEGVVVYRERCVWEGRASRSPGFAK